MRELPLAFLRSEGRVFTGLHAEARAQLRADLDMDLFGTSYVWKIAEDYIIVLPPDQVDVLCQKLAEQ